MIALLLLTGLVAQDPDSLLALGRVQYARPVIGRYAALDAFRAAARLAPDDPEPLYWQMKVGFYLRGAEGDVIAREALLRLFAITPDYKDAWARFQGVYRNPSIWRRAERALARHGDDPIALERRAELLVALDDGAAADSLLDRLLSRRPPGARAALIRSRAAFLRGHVADGYAWHDSAIALAGSDSTEALWEDAWVVASPEESARYTNTLVDDRPAFFARFWQRRDPNLLTRENERVAEHAARLAESRAQYRLLHPQRSIYHSAKSRALGVFGERPEVTDLAWHVDEVQDSALPRAFRAGLTAQGLVYLRHGPPDARAVCIPELRRPLEVPACYSHLDVEGWLYETPDGPQTLSFRRGGEFFWPVSREQVTDIGTLLVTDRSALPAPLRTRAWTVFFRSAQLGLTDVYVKAAGDTAAATMWDAVHQAVPAVAIGRGLLAFAMPPGRYGFGLDVDSAGALGRIRSEIGVPWFAARGARLAISSLLLAAPVSDTSLMDRDAALRAMPPDFVFSAGAPLATYLEVYGLTTDREGRSQYRVRYTFEPVRSLPSRILAAAGAGGSRARVILEFDRTVAGADAIERLVLDPDRLPAGRYRVAVAVTDALRNVKSESASIEIIIR